MESEQQASFVEYVRSRGPWMRQVALRLCRDRHHAEDLVQMSLTRLYRHWSRLLSVRNLDAYVRTVIVRTFIGDRRSSWSRRVDLSATPEEQPAAQGVDHTTRLVLRDAVDGLAPRQRATILLRYYCDLSVEQTAAALDCTEGTVKSQTSRGLQSLRNALEQGEVTLTAAA